MSLTLGAPKTDNFVQGIKSLPLVGYLPPRHPLVQGSTPLIGVGPCARWPHSNFPSVSNYTTSSPLSPHAVVTAMPTHPHPMPSSSLIDARNNSHKSALQLRHIPICQDALLHHHHRRHYHHQSHHQCNQDKMIIGNLCK